MTKSDRKELKKILVVEDDDADLKLILRCLKATGLDVDVTVARDFASALKEGQTDNIDLALLDLCLPDSYGVDTLQNFCKSCPDLPVVVLTGTNDEAMAKESLALGALDYLQKDALGREILRRTIVYSHERSHLYQQLKEQAAQALDLAQKRQDFLARMSHEIRTPLNGIIGALSLYDSSGAAGDAHNARLIASTQAASDILLQTVNDILDLSKFEAGKMSFTIAPVNVWRLLEDVLCVYAPLAQKKGLHLGGVFLCDPAAVIDTDEIRLKQVLNNLVSNAIKFTDRGSVTLTVTLDEQNRPTFAVVDTGCGILDSEVEHIFDWFRQSHQTPKGSLGTGLGLPICKYLIGQLGGAIAVLNNQIASPGAHGATFTATLPITVKTAAETTALPVRRPAVVELDPSLDEDWCDLINRQLAYFKMPTRPADPRHSPGPDSVRISASNLAGVVIPSRLLATAIGGKVPFADVTERPGNQFKEVRFPGLRALIAEDVDLSRELLVAMLKTIDIECVAVSDGLAAVEAVRTHPAGYFDVVLMDCHMPKLDGFGATAKIREWQHGETDCALKIVAITADCLDSARTHCLAAGMDDVLTKPMTLKEIVPLMTKWFADSLRTRDPAATGDSEIDEELFDPAVFASVLRLCAKSSLFSQLVQMFQVNTMERICELFTAVVTGNRPKARDLAHAIKGAACNFGARTLIAASKRFEDACNDSMSPAAGQDLVRDIRREYERVCERLNEYAKHLVSEVGGSTIGVADQPTFAPTKPQRPSADMIHNP